MKREAVLFYKSFDEAISMLSDDDQLKAYRAIVKYGLYGEESDVDGVAGAIFLLAKPQIDANNRRYENGKQGGRPKKIEVEAKNNQSETEQKPTKNRNETEIKAKEKEKVKEKDKVKDNKNNVRVDDVFERAWAMYPEKKGKGKVSDKDKRKIAEIGLDHFTRALSRYMNEIKASSFKHYQNGSTFFHSGYIDYLDENYTPSAERGKSPPFNNAPVREYDMIDLERKLLATN